MSCNVTVLTTAAETVEATCGQKCSFTMMPLSPLRSTKNTDTL